MEIFLYLYLKQKKEVLIMKKKSILILSVMAVTFMLWTSIPVIAAEYPTRAITLIDPYPPGGTLDIQARAFAAVAEKILGQPVVVVNKAGAAGMIGSAEGAKAAPDGYTLTVGCTANTCTIEWELANGRKPAVNKDNFILIGSFTLSPTLVVVPYDNPWKTLGDLIKDCKAKPDQYAFSSGGLYGMSHIPAEILMKAAGFKARHVPYKGGAPALRAVVGGHVDFATQFPPTSIPLYRGNKLRVLAVQSDKRLKSIPEVPTVKELGVNAEFYAWVGIMAPKGTPMEIVEKLRDIAAKAAQDESLTKAIENLGDEVRYKNAQELDKHWDYESKTFSKLYQELIKEKK
jgi:tripartite-type tricarboxylate transporter receptor subunit TctC